MKVSYQVCIVERDVRTIETWKTFQYSVQIRRKVHVTCGQFLYSYSNPLRGRCECYNEWITIQINSFGSFFWLVTEDDPPCAFSEMVLVAASEVVGTSLPPSATSSFEGPDK
jgi:hypothetical protein